VRRAAAGLLATALLLAAVTTAASAGATASSECLWQQHSKRVTKKLKRHGKLKRVKRTKRWWTCQPIPTSDSPVLPTPVLPTPVPPSEEPGPKLERLGVKADDGGLPWSFTPSRPEIAAGEVIVELQNQGEDPHDLNLELEGSGGTAQFQIPVTGPAEQKTGRFTLTPGTYRFWCDLPEHDEKGMHTKVVVS
jgi:plastocyanin